jgi:CHAD domain-containing protein
MNALETTWFRSELGSLMARRKTYAVAEPTDAPRSVVADMVERARRLNAEQLCAHYGNENAHTEHVTRLALRFFDATRRSLGLPASDRALLEKACRLHDVAYRIDPAHHRERSAEIAMREGLKDFSADDRACIAAIIRLHGGNWDVRPNQEHAMRLGAFLRIADGLDWGHVQDAAIVGTKLLRKYVRVRVRSDWLPANVARADLKADLWRAVFPVGIRFERVKSRRSHPIVVPGLHPVEAARRLLSVQYKTIAADVDGAIAGDDPEHLHRIRVAIRRLRSLVRAFRKSLPDTGPVDETLGALGDALGAARDLDVWVAFLHTNEVAETLKSNRRWRAFVRHHEQVHQLQLPTVRRELHSARFNGLRRRMAKLLRSQLPPLVQAGTSSSLEALGAKRFLKELRNVRELASLRDSSSPRKLHRLRVALRRARYLGEFFAPVLGKNAGRLTRRLHQVEKPLAQIHDLDVGLSLIQRSGPAAPRAFAAFLRARREHQQRTIELAWYRLAELEKRARRELQAKPKQTKPRRQV